ncbi:MAG: hypothetical protein ABIH37_03030 [archaeon]
MAKKTNNTLGSWAFLIGLVLAVVVGLLGGLNSTTSLILVIIGLIVGLLNIADKETNAFLMAGAVLIIASAFGGNVLGAVPYIGTIFDALLVLFVPATIVVAIKSVFILAKN